MANFTINITAQENAPPIVGDGERTIEYGTEVVLTRSDFTSNTVPPYSDPEGDLPLNLKVLSLPAAGLLKLNGIDVVVNQILSFIDDIDAENFTYKPDLNETNPLSVIFQFAIADAGSTLYTS